MGGDEGLWKSQYLCYFLSKSFQRCGAFVNLTYIIKLILCFLNKSVKNSKDTQHLLISLYMYYICNWVNDVTWFQTKWNISRTNHGNQFFQKKLLYSFRSSFFWDNKNFNDSATLNRIHDSVGKALRTVNQGPVTADSHAISLSFDLVLEQSPQLALTKPTVSSYKAHN